MSNFGSPRQSASVSKLERKGFVVNRICQNFAGDPGFYVLMSRKRGCTTRLAQIEDDGSVNGSSVEDYLKSL